MTHQKGFTIVEIAVVIVVIAVLATLTVLGFNRTMSNARDDSAGSKTKLIGVALEKYYEQNGRYPDCATQLNQTSLTVATNVLKGIDPGTLTRDGSGAASGTNSLICNGTPNTTSFAYSGTATTFSLQYTEETSGNTVTVSGQHN